ncbi:MAG: hypothetical protein ACYCYE_08425 [Clostridia bacterium]
MKYKKHIFFGLIFCFIFSLHIYADSDKDLKLNKSTYMGLSDSMQITLTSPENNRDRKASEFVLATVTTLDNEKGITITLPETGKDTGVFTSNVGFSANESSKDRKLIKVRRNSNIFVTCEGNTAEATWVPYNSTIKLDKNAYAGLGVIPRITLTDFDLNLSPNLQEEVEVTVMSGTDSKGIAVKLKENKYDSGVFTGTFRLTSSASNVSDQSLHIEYGDTISALYTDKTHTNGEETVSTGKSAWKPEKARLLINKNKFSGLNSKCKITVYDNDMNLKPEVNDTVTVRTFSDTDTEEFDVQLYETDIDSGIFAAEMKFSTYASNSKWNILKVGQKSTVGFHYIDSLDDANIKNTTIKANIAFELVEAKLTTSSDKLEGLKEYLTITVTDPDADNNTQKNYVSADIKTSSGESLTLLLEETGSSTGIFKGKLYFSDKKINDKEKKEYSIVVKQGDSLTIQYSDATVPKGNNVLLEKTVLWTYDIASIAFNKSSYSGYETNAEITVKDDEANTNPRIIDSIRIRVGSTSTPEFDITIKETANDSGVFKGTITLAAEADRVKHCIKVFRGDTIQAYYDEEGKFSSGVVKATAVWQAFNAEIKLDRALYYGSNAKAVITVKDWDASIKPTAKESVTINASAEGNKDYIKVKLIETGENTGTFTGYIIINSSQSYNNVILKDGKRLEIKYLDEGSTGNIVERKAYATWEDHYDVKLQLDKDFYEEYGSYMDIKVIDPGKNKDAALKETVYAYVETKSVASITRITLTETGVNTGIFTCKLKFTDKAPSSGQIRVEAQDEIAVTYKEKANTEELYVSAGFFGE